MVLVGGKRHAARVGHGWTGVVGKLSRSFILPKENDGTVSVASETAPAAVADAVLVKGYDADHVGILSRSDVIREVQQFLDSGLR